MTSNLYSFSLSYVCNFDTKLKIIRLRLTVIILLMIAQPTYSNASIAAETDQPTTIELAEIFKHVLIVNVTS